MALLHIAEPGQSAAPHQQKWAVGIDLGTTNSLVAVVRSGSAETLPDEAGRHLLPSVVHYQAEQAPRVGFDAKADAAQDPLNTLSSVKRLLGKALADVDASHFPYRFSGSENGSLQIETSVGAINPVQVSEALASGDVQVVDIRNEGEVAAGMLPGAVHIPLAELVGRTDELDPAKPVLLYCAGGWRSSVGASFLRARGFVDVSDILGGYNGWLSVQQLAVGSSRG